MWLDDLQRDIWHGVRSLARTPGFTAIAILTLTRCCWGCSPQSP
jgi:hypothetical protein